MIMKYWMDEELWPVLYFDKDKWEWLPFKPFSEKTNQLIDEKIKNLIKNAYEKAKQILKENEQTIHKLAKLLLEKEYLTKEEFISIMKDPSKADEMLKELKEKKKKEKTEESKWKEEKTEEKKDSEKEKVKNILNLLEKFLKTNKKDDEEKKKED
jgi:cell division protease FtsH